MAVDMYLKIAGIDGESKDSAHGGEIDVLAWSWGMSQSGSMHAGGGGGSGKVSVQDISVTKYVDKATSNLLLACCKGDHLDEALLTVRKAGGNPLEYLLITMKGVLVSSVSTGGSQGEDRLTENISLNFREVEVKYQPQDDAGAADGGTIDMTWNIQANTE